MKEKELEKRLGIPPGSTLSALVALAEKVAPKAPWDAFRPLWLALPLLRPRETAAQMRHGTPRNVHPFAETGEDLNHFGFLMDGDDVPTDERPIVHVIPKDDDDVTKIVAPVSRDASDAEWFGARETRPKIGCLVKF